MATINYHEFVLYFFSFNTYKGKKLGYLWLNRKKLMLGFCLDKSLQEITPGVKPKDKYESIQINPDADIPIDFIRQKLEYYLGVIDGKII